MSNITAANRLQAVESALVRNDISKLNDQDRISYINALCESTGLNALTKPFAFYKLQGREVVYATKDCGEQLRKIHGVSTQILSQGVVDGCYEVHVRAQDKTGRTDEDFASIPIGDTNGADLSNLKMKCVTKAKRRVTLSICGLGILDESELDTIAKELKGFANNPQITNPLKAVSEPPQLDQSENIDRDEHIPEVFQDEDFGEYVCTFGKKYPGTKIKDFGEVELDGFIKGLRKFANEAGRSMNPTHALFIEKAEAYLQQHAFTRGKR